MCVLEILEFKNIEIAHLLFKEPSTISTYCLQGNIIDRSDTAGANGKGWKEDKSYTLNTIDRPAVCTELGGGRTLHSK